MVNGKLLPVQVTALDKNPYIIGMRERSAYIEQSEEQQAIDVVDQYAPQYVELEIS